MNADEMKRQAALAAIEHLPSGGIIGVGTGSTVNHFIDALAEVKGRFDGAVSSSEASTDRLREHGIDVLDLNATGGLEVYVDGADESNRQLHLIKGGGGALTREKIVAAASKRFICIADESKLVAVLGAFPLPVEVIPMARSYVARELAALGGNPVWRENVVTDNGNLILDVHGLEIMEPMKLETQINQIAGVVTVGIFAHRPADLLILGTDIDPVILQRARSGHYSQAEIAGLAEERGHDRLVLLGGESTGRVENRAPRTGQIDGPTEQPLLKTRDVALVPVGPPSDPSPPFAHRALGRAGRIDEYSIEFCAIRNLASVGCHIPRTIGTGRKKRARDSRHEVVAEQVGVLEQHPDALGAEQELDHARPVVGQRRLHEFTTGEGAEVDARGLGQRHPGAGRRMLIEVLVQGVAVGFLGHDDPDERHLGGVRVEIPAVVAGRRCRGADAG